ncbi:MAG: phasin family protein [Chloroflexi bacterium]|nr:phasin family protein [Chloroflexota bacterium]MBP7044936.1 phasin family protein [Chloroflexota bacterium]
MTNEVVIEVAEEKNGGLSGMVVDNVHKVFLVGLGAAAMAQDELFNLVDKFVEQGEETEKKVVDSVNEMVDDRKKEAEKANKRAEKEFNKRMEAVLHRLNVPSRAEIRSLNTKITKLSKKIDELNQETVA